MCSTVFVDGFVQIIDISLRFNLGLLLHKLVLVGIGFQMGTVRIQDLSSYKSLCHCLTNDLVKYLLRNVESMTVVGTIPYGVFVCLMFKIARCDSLVEDKNALG